MSRLILVAVFILMLCLVWSQYQLLKTNEKLIDVENAFREQQSINVNTVKLFKDQLARDQLVNSSIIADLTASVENERRLARLASKAFETARDDVERLALFADDMELKLGAVLYENADQCLVADMPSDIYQWLLKFETKNNLSK